MKVKVFIFMCSISCMFFTVNNATGAGKFGFGHIVKYGKKDKLFHSKNLLFYTSDIVGFRFESKKQSRNPFTSDSSLDDVNNFSISSGGKEIKGLRILGKEINLTHLGHKDRPYFPGDYEAVIVIKLPAGMKSGAKYTFSSKLYNYKSITVSWSDSTCLSQCIKVNQVAYLANASAKFALLGKWVGTAGALDFPNVNTFEVVNLKTGKVVLNGKPELRRQAGNKNETPYKIDLTGENLYRLNLSSLKTPGYYYIKIPNVGRSYSFKISDNAYQELLFTTIRMLYHNRCGIPLEKKYTSWVRNKCSKHCKLAIVPEYYSGIKWDNDFHSIKRFLDENKGKLKYKTVSGGYHDAGDFDRRHAHLQIPMLLSFAFEGNPKAFIDKQFKIPESGNGIPDILDEAYFGLIFSLMTQWPDGGVPAGSEAWGHPKTNSGNNDWCTNVDNESTDYVILPVIQDSTIKFALAAAQLSHLMKKYPAGKKKANKLLKAAIKAYALAVKKFPPTNDEQKTWFAGAATQLLRSTQQKKYAVDIEKYKLAKYDFLKLPAAIFATSYAILPEKTPELDKAFQAKLKADFQGAVLWAYNSFIKKEGYISFRHPWAPIMAGTASGNQAIFPALAYIATKNPELKEILTLTADTVLGANASGMVFATGIGQKHFQHPLHLDSMNDNIEESVPGCWVYAPYARGAHHLERNSGMVPEKGKRPLGYQFLDVDQCVPQAEFTVWENSAPMTMIFGVLASDTPKIYNSKLPKPRK